MPLKAPSPWRWVISLYYMEGLPYTLVVFLSEIYYKALNLSNAKITFYTSLLGLPWLIKPLWCPLIERVGTYRRWIISLEILMALLCLPLAFATTSSDFFLISFITLLLIAFVSATHDFNADGYYIVTLSEQQQNAFLGWRSASYQGAKLSCIGGMVTLAGYLQPYYGLAATWQRIYLMLAGLILVLAIYHFTLPQPKKSPPKASTSAAVFKSAFKLPGTLATLLTVLLILTGQIQVNKILPLYMLDHTENGLQLSTLHIGEIYGTLSMLAMILGGILGGRLIARFGLKQTFMPFVCLLALSILPLALHSWLKAHLALLVWVVVMNQFAFGLMATGQLSLMIQWAKQSDYVATAYALATAAMVLGFIYPGLFAGLIQETLGYPGFFVWCALCCVPALIFAKYAMAITTKHSEHNSS